MMNALVYVAIISLAIVSAETNTLRELTYPCYIWEIFDTNSCINIFCSDIPSDRTIRYEVWIESYNNMSCDIWDSTYETGCEDSIPYCHYYNYDAGPFVYNYALLAITPQNYYPNTTVYVYWDVREGTDDDDDDSSSDASYIRSSIWLFWIGLMFSLIY